MTSYFLMRCKIFCIKLVIFCTLLPRMWSRSNLELSCQHHRWLFGLGFGRFHGSEWLHDICKRCSVNFHVPIQYHVSGSRWVAILRGISGCPKVLKILPVKYQHPREPCDYQGCRKSMTKVALIWGDQEFEPNSSVL